METSVYVALSGQMAQAKRMETIAQNIANSNTVGYRASGVQFKSLISQTSKFQTEFSSPGENYISEQSGGFDKTGGQLDIAIQGNGYLAFDGPARPFYSRDGRIMMTSDGQLASISGYPLLDSGGSTIAVNPKGGPITISRTGVVLQDGAQRGAIGMFEIDISGGYSRFENSGIVPLAEPQAIVAFEKSGILQGYLEGSNVNAINEMVRMIEVSRAFESITSLSDLAQDVERSAIQTLASTR
jgi:flagellar basal-body rod protein FlgF